MIEALLGRNKTCPISVIGHVLCEKCEKICPLSMVNPKFSPQSFIREIVMNSEEDYSVREEVWKCLTCGACSSECPLGIQLFQFSREARKQRKASTIARTMSDYHIFKNLAEELSKPEVRLDAVKSGLLRVPRDAKVSKRGETALFFGCLPFFDDVFSELGFQGKETVANAIRILNRLGVTPVIGKTVCCGHDRLWVGDEETFLKLTKKNVRELRRAGVKRIVAVCAECYRTLKFEHPDHLKEFDFEVLHLSELVAKAIGEGRFKYEGAVDAKVTYHDPCRLGRLGGIFDEPRLTITSIPGVEFAEMRHNQKEAICCGVCGWINCDDEAKKIRDLRLDEAEETGAEILVTACPKCEAHFKCHIKEEGRKTDLRIVDLTDLIAQGMESIPKL